ncbi:CoA transferase [Nocardiopsis alba]|uniref:CoA transferase n=1 Tax=Nocardiopsis alba TaxID=53437 RepID=UPI003400D8D7
MITDGTPMAPLAGVVVRAIGDTTPVRVALDRLRAAGCDVVRGEGPPPASAPAGRIELLATPEGGPVEGGCDLTWAPPGSTVAPEDEQDVQALCGLAHLHGRSLGGARPLPIDYASVCAGVLASQAVMAAVSAGPVGTRSTVSVAGAALSAAAPYIAESAASEGGPSTVVDGTRPPFRSLDGVVFEIETLDPEAWLRFWTALGAPTAAIASGWPLFQRRFATAVCPLPDELSGILASTRFDRTRAVGLDTGVGVVALRPPGSVPDARPVSPWRLRGVGGPADLRSRWAPREGAPLAGLRVVEATNRIQGPLAGLLLSFLGADVVRMEPPGGDPMRGVPPLAGGVSARFTALNRGKDAVEIDLASWEGRESATALVAEADVLLYNWPPGRAERFGLGMEDLAERAPGLVHAHVDGWVDEGPEDPVPATDFPVQAHGGIAHLLAEGGRPAPSLLTLTDVLGGIIAAEAVTAALALRSRLGTGVGARTGLVDAARLLREVGRATGREEPSVLVPVEDPRCVVDLFPDSFTTIDGVPHPRSPWTSTPMEVGRR